MNYIHHKFSTTLDQIHNLQIMNNTFHVAEKEMHYHIILEVNMGFHKASPLAIHI